MHQLTLANRLTCYVTAHCCSPYLKHVLHSGRTMQMMLVTRYTALHRVVSYNVQVVQRCSESVGQLVEE